MQAIYCLQVVYKAWLSFALGYRQNSVLTYHSACTSVALEVSYHPSEVIEAHISFFTLEEWRKELSMLLSDIRGEGGRTEILKSLNNEAGAAWAKVTTFFVVSL